MTASQTWESMVAGRSGIGPITHFDASQMPVKIAGEVVGFDPVAALGRRNAKRMDRFCQFAVVAADEAVAQSGLDWENEDPEKVGIVFGSGIGGLSEILSGDRGYREGGWKGMSPFFVPRALTNIAAGQMAMRYGAQGPNLCVVTACASGNHALGEAAHIIRRGEADVIIAGGSESPIVAPSVAGFTVMKALSRNPDATGASRPFDRDRDGFVMGEGAGMLVLEEFEHARARGAVIYAELVGYGNTNDAHHLTAPAPNGAGAARCMRMALRTAGVDPSDVGYINAHGTSTPQNDVNETRAIHSVFGDHASSLMVSSTKSVTGHLLGAAGGIESLATVMALHTGVIPPTATWEARDPDCDLDYVPKDARQAPIAFAISNSFGFGGTNASLVFKAFS
jgi:3-oxoacyl-[acyl-carrier-protein] synthase II